MVEAIVLIVALALAAFGVVGAVLPFVPGPLFSLAGVLVYWWGTGYTDPSILILLGFALVAMIALGADILGGAVGAGSAVNNNWTAVVAGIAGFALVPVAGPLGVLAGVSGVTFLFAYRDSGSTKTGLVAATGATLGLLASIAIQILLALAMALALVVLIML